MNDPRVESAAPSALERELARMLPGLVRALQRRGFASEPAEELAQEASLRALERQHLFQTGRPLLPWLVVIALRRGREGRPLPASSRETQPARELSPEESAVLREEQARLRSALPVLSRVQRSIIDLFYREEMTIVEIAVRLQLRQGTVKSHLHRARRALAQELGEGDRR